MKLRKKLSFIAMLALLTVVTVACSVTTITRIEMVTPPQNVYVAELVPGTTDEYVDKTVDATVKIYYSDNNNSGDINIKNASSYGLVVAGNKYSTPGTYTLTVTYNSIVVSYQYQVVAPTTTATVCVATENELRTAIGASDANTVIEVTADITLATSIYVNKPIHLKGANANGNQKPTITFTNNGKAFYAAAGTFAHIRFENIIFKNTDPAVSGNSEYFFVRETGVMSYFTEFTVKNCEIDGFNEAISIKSDNPSVTVQPKLTCTNVNIIGTTLKNAPVKGIYIESADYITISNNIFENCATGTFVNYYYPCVIDINLKYRNYEKVEITNNAFTNNGNAPEGNPFNFNKSAGGYGYGAIIAVKARADVGANDYQKVPATLRQLNVTSNTFENCFSAYKNNTVGDITQTNPDENAQNGSGITNYGIGYGISFILLGEDVKSKDYDGIDLSGVQIANNEVLGEDEYTGNAISFLKWYEERLTSKAAANGKMAGSYK